MTAGMWNGGQRRLRESLYYSVRGCLVRRRRCFLAQVFRVFMSSSASTAATSVSSPGLARFDFSPEFSLLLMACSLRRDQEPAPHLDFGTSLDWQRVLRLAEHHNVTPLLYQALRADTGRIPPAILAELQARFEGIARKKL